MDNIAVVLDGMLFDVVSPANAPYITHTEHDVLVWAELLGINVDVDLDLMWIAYEAMRQATPRPWWLCRDRESRRLVFLNSDTKEVSLRHPKQDKFEQWMRQVLEHRAHVVVTLSAGLSPSGSGAACVVCAWLSGRSILKRIADPYVKPFHELRAELVSVLRLPPHAEGRFLLPDGTVLGRRHNSLSVAEVFSLPCPYRYPPGASHGRADNAESVRRTLGWLQEQLAEIPSVADEPLIVARFAL